MNELERLAAFLAGLTFDILPEAVRRAAKLCVLDTVGAAVGAVCDPQAAGVMQTFAGIDKSSGNASVWGTNLRFNAPRAAYINGMTGHVFELDDVHTRSKTHIGTVVIPAAWALAEELGASGRDFIRAVVAGYEAASRIGMGFGVKSHRECGWHATSTAGTFGAAAAAAKLLGLSEKETVSALALAGTQSFGVWAFLADGATNKVLHPAGAARAGLEAAYLAKAGMTGPRRILEAEDGGLFPAMSRAYDLPRVSAGLGETWEITQLDKKPYPCCRSTHPAIDAALLLSKRRAFRPEDIREILVDTYRVGYLQCGASEPSRFPEKPSEAKFSTPYTVAAALLCDGVGLEHFSPERIGDPAVQSLVRRVTVRPDEWFTARYPEHWGARMTILFRDGTDLSAEVPDASGSAYAPMTEEQVIAKALGCAAPVMGAARADEMKERMLCMEGWTKLPDLSV